MDPRVPGSLRRRLAGVLAAAVALPLVVVGYTMVRLRQAADAEGARLAASVAHQAADDVDRLLQEASDLLVTMASSTRVLDESPAGCPSSVRILPHATDRFAAFGIADTTGRILCASYPGGEGLALADPRFVGRALAAHAAVLSDRTTLPGSGEPVLLMALSARRLTESAPRALAFAAIAADDLIDAPMVDHLEAGTALWVLDRHGAVVARHPAGAAPPAGLPALAGAAARSRRDSTGATRHLGLQALEARGPSRLTVVVEAPSNAVLTGLRGLLDAAVLTGLGAMLAGIAISMFGWKRVLLDDLRRLVDAAQRIGGGEFGASAAIPAERGELAHVSRSLDELGARLAERERDRGELLRQLEAGRERLQLLYDALPVGIAVLDRDGIVADWSPGMQQLLGWPADEVIGRPPPFVPPELEAQAQAMRRGVLAGGGACYETERFCRDGHRLPVSVYLAPVRDRDGHVTGTVAVVASIAERREVEAREREALEEARVAGRRLEATVEELRRLSRHLHHVREEEQTRIAREIHDEFGQLLTGLKVDLRILRTGLGGMPGAEALAARVDGMDALVDQMVTVGRRIVNELRPVSLDKVGLGPVLETLAQDTARRAGIPVEARADGDFTRLAPAKANALYRIAQEALTNVLRHSGASRAALRLARRNGHVRLEVEDDGRGLSLPARPGAMGLVGMRERATLQGGRFRLERGEAGGTRVVAEVPWEESAGLG